MRGGWCVRSTAPDRELRENHRGVGAAVDLQLLEGVAEIVLDGLVAQAECDRNLFVRLALDNLLENAALLWRERLPACTVRFDAVGDLVEHRLGDFRVEYGLPGR